MKQAFFLHPFTRVLAAGALLFPLAVSFASCAQVDRDFGGQAGGISSSSSSTACEPGTVAACYSGPDGTEGVGICAAGTRVCNDDGLDYGPCEGETLPLPTDDCATPADEDCDGTAAACPLTTLWARSFEMPVLSVPQVATDADGNILVVGRFSGTFDLGDGHVVEPPPVANPSSWFIAKFDPDGTTIWARSLGTFNSYTVADVTIAPGGSILVAGPYYGHFELESFQSDSIQGSNDMFVASLSGDDGSAEWCRFFGGTGSEQISKIGLDANENVLLLGTFGGQLSMGNITRTSTGNTDTFFAKLSPGALSVTYLRNYFSTTNSYHFMSGLAVDSSGGAAIVGDFSESVNVGAGLLNAAGSTDIVTARIGADGSTLDAKRFGGVDSDRGFDVSIGPEDEMTMISRVQGVTDFGGGPIGVTDGNQFVLASYTKEGAHRFSTAFGEERSNANLAVVRVNEQGESYVGGYFNQRLVFGEQTFEVTGGVGNSDVDFFIVKFDAEGNHLASRAVGTPQSDGLFDMSLDPRGNLAIVGITLGSGFDLGTGSLSSSEQSATLFMAKLAR
ncbi:hypothetical protein [Chondromyces crocatus]|uniref:Uncharacterized protein n=1 Tax=Chondromyces crocatus TaxID=52 RepID=A0A0K1ETG6_CHOCO|nr:hypothetical protein [Chondromyces crocatus]AKT44146.1 uncharacterized protein CMC5_083860 [Chondromyces crocatus]